MNITVVGACGKLGSQICEVLTKNGHTVEKVDLTLNNSISTSKNTDGIIDASLHTATISTALFAASHNTPLLICSTGHSPNQQKQIRKICSNIPFCFCPNLSLGILFLQTCLSNLKILPAANYTITETHHISKKDKPSGTALLLQNQIAKNTKTIPSISSIRSGDKIGTHQISIALNGEEITLTHTAHSRSIYANGAFKAIEALISSSPGEHSFCELIGGSYEN